MPEKIQEMITTLMDGVGLKVPYTDMEITELDPKGNPSNPVIWIKITPAVRSWLQYQEQRPSWASHWASVEDRLILIVTAISN